MEEMFASTTNRVESLESQNNMLKSNVEEKEVVVQTNSEELKNLKNEKDDLESQVSWNKKKTRINI